MTHLRLGMLFYQNQPNCLHKKRCILCQITRKRFRAHLKYYDVITIVRLKSDPFIIILTSIISWSILVLEELFWISLGSICCLSCCYSCYQTYVLRKIKTEFVNRNVNRDLQFWAIMAVWENCNSNNTEKFYVKI